jgi:hypothetical protein
MGELTWNMFDVVPLPRTGVTSDIPHSRPILGNFERSLITTDPSTRDMVGPLFGHPEVVGVVHFTFYFLSIGGRGETGCSCSVEFFG